MPIKAEPNYQLCTFNVANDLAERLRLVGVPVDTIYEILDNGEKHDTTDENWSDNGQSHQYVAKVWGGPEQNLGITDAMFKEKGYNYETFSKLATTSNKLPVEAAILPLKGNIDAINTNLNRQMR